MKSDSQMSVRYNDWAVVKSQQPRAKSLGSNQKVWRATNNFLVGYNEENRMMARIHEFGIRKKKNQKSAYWDGSYYLDKK